MTYAEDYPKPPPPGQPPLTDPLDLVAEWLYETGYPFDWSNEKPPPECLRARIEQIWPERDGYEPGSEDYDGYRATVAEEGGWRDG